MCAVPCSYGDIGQACARLARAFRMKVVALRRRTQLTEAELAEGILVRGYSSHGLTHTHTHTQADRHVRARAHPQC